MHPALPPRPFRRPPPSARSDDEVADDYLEYIADVLAAVRGTNH